MSISIYGHAYTRVLTYMADGIHKEFISPGGAAFLAKLLNHKSTELTPDYRREYAELGFFEDKKNKKSYCAISRRMGYAEGKTEFISGSDSDNSALIWDEGFGELSLPDGKIPTLWASNKVLPDKIQFSKVAENCFLFLDANVLRKAGAMISRQISWERTAAELIWQIQNNAAISYLLKAPHILISFAEDGAVYIKRENDVLTAALFLTHGGGEGTLREKLQGEFDTAFIHMTAIIAQQFLVETTEKQSLQIVRMLKSAEVLMIAGHMISASEVGYDLDTLECEEVSFDIPVKTDQSVIDPDNWCIANNVSDKRIFDIAFNYVMEGAKEIEGLPQLSFGFLTTIDRWEIEAFQNIRNLIVGYANADSVRPLSIAVFGSPGSGKSFGVTQIAKNVLPGKVEKLEFNVSQFTSVADLGAAFQKVRDAILEGKLPLVFFDEFDSVGLDGSPLGWVKSFLMPMQDGKFKDDNGEHPLGKCILVFAGGTSSSFEEFCKPMHIENKIASLRDSRLQATREEHYRQAGVKPSHMIIVDKDANINDEQSLIKKHEHFKSVKGPDFISRLKGIINVLGPNQKDDNDKNYILRRALLLRGLCERKGFVKKGIAQVSKNIVWALLLVPEYKHGARSMEAILDMSRMEGNVWEPVSLPFYSQLALHVDADAFIKLVLREVILNSYNEKLAIAIHDDYCKKMKENGNGKHPSVVSWEDSVNKDSNREQAASFAEKLNTIGYSYDSGDTPFPSVEEFTEDEVKLLAINEHIRWMNEKLAKGMEYAPLEYGMELAQKSISEKEWDALSDEERTNLAIKKLREDNKHHLLVPFEKLPKDEQKKDINVAKSIIPLLKSIGLRVYKTV